MNRWKTLALLTTGLAIGLLTAQLELVAPAAHAEEPPAATKKCDWSYVSWQNMKMTPNGNVPSSPKPAYKKLRENGWHAVGTIIQNGTTVHILMEKCQR